MYIWAWGLGGGLWGYFRPHAFWLNLITCLTALKYKAVYQHGVSLVGLSVGGASTPCLLFLIIGSFRVGLINRCPHSATGVLMDMLNTARI